MAGPTIAPPARIPLLLRPGIWIAEKLTGRPLLPARILSWNWKTALGSGLLEAFTPHGKGPAQVRLLKLVRLKASLATACPFCLDMNSAQIETTGITQAELDALARPGGEDEVASLSARERCAIRFAMAISQTPPTISEPLAAEVKALFSEREIVRVAATAAQVNYWARLIQAFGIPPAGFSETCPLRLPPLP